MNSNNEEFVALKKAAGMLGVTEMTIRNWDKNGKIQVVRAANGRRKVPMSEIERINVMRKPYLDFLNS